jgi:3-oxoacyl-[acyl-carrier protein] reductase
MADFNVRVNCIAPGPIDTNLLKGITAEQIHKIVSQQIIPKQFAPDSVADLVELLIDSRSDSLSGQVLHVGGV